MVASSLLLLLAGTTAAGADPCCSWDGCGTCGDTTSYCKSTQSACENDCGGKWCPSGASGPSGYDLPNVCDSKAKGAPKAARAPRIRPGARVLGFAAQ